MFHQRNVTRPIGVVFYSDYSLLSSTQSMRVHQTVALLVAASTSPYSYVTGIVPTSSLFLGCRKFPDWASLVEMIVYRFLKMRRTGCEMAIGVTFEFDMCQCQFSLPAVNLVSSFKISYFVLIGPRSRTALGYRTLKPDE